MSVIYLYMLNDKLTVDQPVPSSGDSATLYNITTESSFSSQSLDEKESISQNTDFSYDTIKTREQYYDIHEVNNPISREYRWVGCICCTGFFIVCIIIILIKNTFREVGRNLMSQII